MVSMEIMEEAMEASAEPLHAFSLSLWHTTNHDTSNVAGDIDFG